jgi:hypothetical protein
MNNMNQNLIPIERKDGVTLYGKVIDKNGRLGQFEVHSDILGNNRTVYHLLSDAQNRMKALIGVKTS